MDNGTCHSIEKVTKSQYCRRRHAGALSQTTAAKGVKLARALSMFLDLYCLRQLHIYMHYINYSEFNV